MTRSNYRIVRFTPEAVWIVDQDLGNMSVTNDAEAVVAEVHASYPNRHIVYRDSDGNWDELVHDNGVFKGFKEWNEAKR